MKELQKLLKVTKSNFAIQRKPLYKNRNAGLVGLTAPELEHPLNAKAAISVFCWYAVKQMGFDIKDVSGFIGLQPQEVTLCLVNHENLINQERARRKYRTKLALVAKGMQL